jgi:uncharacterized alpha-E superfamily protein
MALLSRNADRIYWAARYLERAEDTARLVQEFGELFDDMPSDDPNENAFRWNPLLAVVGDRTFLETQASERDVDEQCCRVRRPSPSEPAHDPRSAPP